MSATETATTSRSDFEINSRFASYYGNIAASRYAEGLHSDAKHYASLAWRYVQHATPELSGWTMLMLREVTP